MLLVSVATGSHSALAGSFVTADMAILQVAFFYDACDSAAFGVGAVDVASDRARTLTCLPTRHPRRPVHHALATPRSAADVVARRPPGGHHCRLPFRSAAAPCSYGLPRARPFPVPFPSLVWPHEGAVRYGDPPGVLAGTAVGGADPANDHDDCVVVEFGQNPEGVRACSDRCDRRGSFARHLACDALRGRCARVWRRTSSPFRHDLAQSPSKIAGKAVLRISMYSPTSRASGPSER